MALEQLQTWKVADFSSNVPTDPDLISCVSPLSMKIAAHVAKFCIQTSEDFFGAVTIWSGLRSWQDERGSV